MLMTTQEFVTKLFDQGEWEYRLPREDKNFIAQVENEVFNAVFEILDRADVDMDNVSSAAKDRILRQVSEVVSRELALDRMVAG